MMDIPQVLAVLRPNDDWGPCAQSDSDYAAMAAKWRGASPVPTEAEMLAAWTTIEANAPAEKAKAAKHEAKRAATAKGPGSRMLRAAIAVMFKAFREPLNEIIESLKKNDFSKLKKMPNLTATEIAAMLASEIDGEAEIDDETDAT